MEYIKVKLGYYWLYEQNQIKRLSELFVKYTKKIKQLLRNRDELLKLLETEPIKSICIALSLAFWVAVCFYAGLKY